MSMSMDGAMLIAVHEARSACKGEPDLMERIRKAMCACRDHWMETNEDKQFRSAVAAAVLESEGDERDRIERSARSLNRLGAVLNALQAGVPVDLESMAAEEPQKDIIALSKMWHECAKS